MKNLLYLFLILTFFMSCKKSINDFTYLEKSIFEPLSAEEINEVVKLDSSFYTTYKVITENNLRFESELEKSKFVEINYLRIHEFLLFVKKNELQISESDYSPEIHDKNESLYLNKDLKCFEYIDFRTLYFHKKMPCEQEPARNTDLDYSIDTVAVIDTSGLF